MRTWTRQAGLPVVTFTRSGTNSRAWTARQEWLTGTNGTGSRQWFIPIREGPLKSPDTVMDKSI